MSIQNPINQFPEGVLEGNDQGALISLTTPSGFLFSEGTMNHRSSGQLLASLNHGSAGFSFTNLLPDERMDTLDVLREFVSNNGADLFYRIGVRSGEQIMIRVAGTKAPDLADLDIEEVTP